MQNTTTAVTLETEYEGTKKTATEHVEQKDASNPDLMTPWQAMRQSWPAVLCCLFATIGPLMYGFDMVVVGACISMPAFQ